MEALEGQPQISYPCSWPYRIICADEDELRGAIGAIVGDAAHTLARIGGSASGRYSRMELVVTVRDEEQRNAIFAALGRLATVRFVL